MPYDVVIVGGGPAGLSAALALGRARRRVLVCDGGPKRNAAAENIHNFLTRDGTPPGEFRRVAREQLAAYPSVELQDTRVLGVAGPSGELQVTLEHAEVRARRLLLCTGMVDELLPIEGFAELWGAAIFQCPYCHGWEARERAWGYLARDAAALHFSVLLRSWSTDITAFTNAAFDVEPSLRAHLEAMGVHLETRPILRLRRHGRLLEGIELADGSSLPCGALFAHPPQRHVDLVATLGLALDADGFVHVDPLSRETSMPGVYAGGDLTTRAQGAIFAAATGAQAAGMLNHALVADLAASGLL